MSKIFMRWAVSTPSYKKSPSPKSPTAQQRAPARVNLYETYGVLFSVGSSMIVFFTITSRVDVIVAFLLPV